MPTLHQPLSVILPAFVKGTFTAVYGHFESISSYTIVKYTNNCGKFKTKMTISPSDPEDCEIINSEVSNPKLHTCCGAKYVDFEVTIQTGNRAFFRKLSCIRRRYSEFLWLRNKLSSREINGFQSEREVPSLPPKKVFGRFEPKFLRSRQSGLKTFLENVFKVTDYLSFSGLHLFLQSDLSTQDIDSFLSGSCTKHSSVEDIIKSQETTDTSCSEHKACNTCPCITITDSDSWVTIKEDYACFP